MSKVFIIAEAGVNHNGSLALAKRMVAVAARAGADAVKFQTFNADALVSAFAPKARYQLRTTAKKETQRDMIRRLELDLAAHQALIAHCRQKKIMFLSSPFDLQSIDQLKKLKLRIFKIPSGEITNLPYLRKIAALRKKVILSTGMSTMTEIAAALEVLCRGGMKVKDITVLQCNTEYPTPFRDVNLSAMLTIRDKFNVAVGYSDHTEGIEVPVAAVALGARVIEKHFTLDKTMAGPDHQASLEPDELKAMVCAIRHIEQAVGNGVKAPSASERKNIPIARKSIVAARDIRAGEILDPSNITVKRPGNGISPMRWDSVLGRRAVRSFRKDERIRL
jgi:N,N'-diacetyllegionaminate synthase